MSIAQSFFTNPGTLGDSTSYRFNKRGAEINISYGEGYNSVPSGSEMVNFVYRLKG